ncbi:MAG: efflux RND transporter permease subunit [Spirochaetaceae bacterium]|nr:MAG: efflux RND transporter permease subunit [Spirochaetaceae bacterium]
MRDTGSVLLVVIGVFWFYYLLGESISMFSLMGLVMLAGIVVNNGIVLVDYANRLRHLRGGNACRLRPGRHGGTRQGGMRQ